jgi:O-antigen/teichoic acid export membrane protein
MHWKFDFGLWKRMFRYAMPLLVVGVAGTINLVFDNFFLMWLLPGTEVENAAQVGIYKACMRIAILMNLITQAFNYAAEPFFFKQIAATDQKVKYARTTQAFALVSSITILAIALNIDWIKYLIAENKWGALELVPIMLLAYFFLGLQYNFAVWYKVTDRTFIGAMIAIVGAVITIVGNIWLIPLIGIWGSAIATLSCFAVVAILTYIIGQYHFKVRYKIGKIAMYLLSAIVVFGFAKIIDHAEWSLIATIIAKCTLLLLYIAAWIFAERKEYAFLLSRFTRS